MHQNYVGNPDEIADIIIKKITTQDQFYSANLDFDFHPACDRKARWFGVKRLHEFGEEDMSLYANSYGGGYVPVWRFVDDLNEGCCLKDLDVLKQELKETLVDMICSISGIKETETIEARFPSS